ncbi:hypothetical protein HY522_03485 [bacterium]|nr:hypothetical protein [bacterium]
MRPSSRSLVVLSALTLSVLVWGVFQLVASNYFREFAIQEVHALFVSHGLVCAVLLAAWAAFFILRNRRQLEEQVAEKEEQFDRRMAQAEKMASIGQIAAGVAHQLNTPLGSIMLTAEMLEEEVNGNPEMKEEIQKIFRNANYCKGVVRNLLLYARPRREEFKEESVCFIIRRAVALFDDELKKRGIKMEMAVDCRECAMICNGNLMEQLIFNLMQNAVDAQPRGGRIDIKTVVPGDGTLNIQVSDGGPGIPPDVLEHIFEPFYTTKSSERGTGLGLAIARRIAEDHGGAIRVKSQVGGGTTFTISLPARPVAMAHAS